MEKKSPASLADCIDYGFVLDIHTIRCIAVYVVSALANLHKRGVSHGVAYDLSSFRVERHGQQHPSPCQRFLRSNGLRLSLASQRRERDAGRHRPSGFADDRAVRREREPREGLLHHRRLGCHPPQLHNDLFGKEGCIDGIIARRSTIEGAQS